MNILNWSRATWLAAVVVSTTSSLQAATISVADWNVGNLPNTPDDETRLGTVLGHIGTLAGRPLDLLALAETDTASIAPTVAVASSTYGGIYASLLSSADGGGDRTGVVYNTATLSVLSNGEVSGTLTHRILRTHFQPIGGAANSDFYLYSIHLKSGAGTADRADRANEAAVLRADADALGSANVIFVGDFNWQSATERGPAGTSAYEVFAGAGEGRATDAVNAVGDWHANPSFISLHTNDPGASMDDRFDMQLISDELRDGVGLDYLAGSYQVVGNNGTHTLGSDIRTGTGAPANVLDALYNFSDHLPVLAGYRFDLPEPTTLVVAAGAVVLTRRRRT